MKWVKAHYFKRIICSESMQNKFAAATKFCMQMYHCVYLNIMFPIHLLN